MIVVEDCLVADVIVLKREELSVRARTQSYTLLRARTMADGLEHHFAANHDLDRLSKLPRRCGRERTVGPWPQLATEARAKEFCHYADVLLRQAEHLRKHASSVEKGLSGLV